MNQHPTLEVQTVAFERHPYAGGTNSSYLKSPLRWKYKQLLSKCIPTLEVHTVAFKSHPYAGGTSTGSMNQLPTLEVQTVAI